MDRAEALAQLHSSLDERWRPEDVAVVAVRGLLAELPDGPRRKLQSMAAMRERSYGMVGYTSMSSDFERPQYAGAQVARTVELAGIFGLELNGVADTSDTGAVAAWCADTAARIDAAGLSTGRTAKLRRSVARAARKNSTAATMALSRRLAQIGRSGFAAQLDVEQFSADPATAVAVAYLHSRRSLRREFALYGKAGTADEVIDAFDKALAQSDTTDWWVWAHARPTPAVLSRLTDEQRTSLLVDWSEAMQTAARRLAELERTSTYAHGRVTVRCGDNSTEWNIAARAYNTARDNWFACLDACGLSVARVTCCPPKALRLMAADLVYAHSVFGGGDQHPDSQVAQLLPKPWDVVAGDAECSEADVLAACEAAGVPADGWVQLRAKRATEQLAATPELVHGIAVADPLLAGVLRRAGAWSGPSKASDVDHATLETIAEQMPEAFGRGI